MDNLSKRMGLEPLIPLQKEGISEALRNRAWTVVYDTLEKDIDPGYVTGYDQKRWTGNAPRLIRSIWTEFLKVPSDTITGIADRDMRYLKDEFFGFDWKKFYGFIKFFVAIDPNEGEELINKFNVIFEQESSIYKFSAEGELSEVIPKFESQALEEAEKELPETAALHIQKAANFYFDKDSPDYPNSLKESGSAFEAYFREVTGSNKSFDGILKDSPLIEKLNLNPKVKEVIEKLWGFTCDASGARHSFKPGHPAVTKDDAWFVLVVVSAVMNYVKKA